MSLVRRLQERHTKSGERNRELSVGALATVATVATVREISPQVTNSNTASGKLYERSQGLVPLCDRIPSKNSTEGYRISSTSRTQGGNVAINRQAHPALERSGQTGITNETTLTVATGATHRPVPSCSTCRYVSCFNDCKIPVESGLSKKFMLISHPSGGESCLSYRQKLSVQVEVLLRKIRQAYEEKTITDRDYSEATRSVENAPFEASLLSEWDSLIEICRRANR